MRAEPEINKVLPEHGREAGGEELMKAINRQVTLEDYDKDYKDFVDKFKPKKTTDDCYTPDNVFRAVVDWVVKEYGINEADIVRPFWPGGDYERYPYTEKSVVVDNPPFSIVSQICKFYNQYEIPFFLFAPYLTNLGIGAGAANIQHIITGSAITYENGAVVDTAFVTNMDKWFIRSAPDLGRAIKEADEENRKAKKKQQPKYSYPNEVIHSAMVGYLATHGVHIKIPHGDTWFIRRLDSQVGSGKALFGSGFLLSERAAAERAAAERWPLSDGERKIIKTLRDDALAPEWEEDEPI